MLGWFHGIGEYILTVNNILNDCASLKFDFLILNFTLMWELQCCSRWNSVQLFSRSKWIHNWSLFSSMLNHRSCLNCAHLLAILSSWRPTKLSSIWSSWILLSPQNFVRAWRYIIFSILSRCTWNWRLSRRS